MNEKIKPVVYIFHGNDELEINKAVEQMTGQLGDPTTVEMNTTTLDGGHAGIDEILNAAATMPFLAERRVVILHNPLASLKTKEKQTEFLEMLEKLPQTAALIMIIDDEMKVRRGERSWEKMKASHFMVKWQQKNAERAMIKGFPLPFQNAMPVWIKKYAAQNGGEFTQEAALALSNQLDNDTRLAAEEVNKLLMYVDYDRPVQVKDVELLSTSRSQLNIFDLVDNVATSQKENALRVMHGLLANEEVFSLLPMIIRQFRLLIQTREIMDEGGSVQEVQQELKQINFVARKLVNQAGSFTMQRLIDIYKQLQGIDEAIKTGKTEAKTAMSLFIAEL